MSATAIWLYALTVVVIAGLAFWAGAAWMIWHLLH